VDLAASNPPKPDLTTLEDYAPLVGSEAVERILNKCKSVHDLRVVNISSTRSGGGVAELLSSLTLLMNSAGIKTGWRVIEGRPEFFSVTKKFHNALQGAEVAITEQEKRIYEEVAYENAIRMDLDHDIVIVHDPQPLPIIVHRKRKAPWIWRCHVDLTHPNPDLWDYLKPFVERYDAVVLSLPEYAQNLTTPQRFIAPAIDPFSSTNKDLSAKEIQDRLAHYDIPTDLPLVVQVSRFDKWKDPQGVIDAFRLARREVDCTLVLVGNFAADDPEGQDVFEALCESAEERIHIISAQDSILVNALQRSAAVVMQKSLREGFGLTVAEAMWKGAAVIGGNVGGIKHQIDDGASGFLVDSVEQAAERIVRLVKDEPLRRRIGARARETVRERYLMTRLLEDWLDLVASFETVFRLKARANARGREHGHAKPTSFAG
jgi:trehalose synthase